MEGLSISITPSAWVERTDQGELMGPWTSSRSRTLEAGEPNPIWRRYPIKKIIGHFGKENIFYYFIVIYCYEYLILDSFEEAEKMVDVLSGCSSDEVEEVPGLQPSMFSRPSTGLLGTHKRQKRKNKDFTTGETTGLKIQYVVCWYFFNLPLYR
jgi:hypothetical protein